MLSTASKHRPAKDHPTLNTQQRLRTQLQVERYCTQHQQPCDFTVYSSATSPSPPPLRKLGEELLHHEPRHSPILPRRQCRQCCRRNLYPWRCRNEDIQGSIWTSLIGVRRHDVIWWWFLVLRRGIDGNILGWLFYDAQEVYDSVSNFLPYLRQTLSYHIWVIASKDDVKIINCVWDFVLCIPLPFPSLTTFPAAIKNHTLPSISTARDTTLAPKRRRTLT